MNSWIAVVCVTLALLHSALAGYFLDQSQGGVVTSYKIPAQGVWQSFKPSWTGSLNRIDVYLGPDVPAVACVPYEGTLSVFRGAGAPRAPFFQDSQLLLEQPVKGICKCSEENCLTWQTFDLRTPVDVVAEHTYAFSLTAHTGVVTSKLPPSFRIGVIVADVYQRGTNDFAVPGYDYTFKSFMSAQSDNANLFSSTAAPSGSADNETHTTQSTSSGAFAGIGVAVALLALVAVVIAVVAYRRRTTRKVKSWYSAEEMAQELRSRFGAGDAPHRQIFTHRSAFLESDEARALEYDNNPSLVALSGMSKRTALVLASVPGAELPSVADTDTDDSSMFSKNVENGARAPQTSVRGKTLYDALRTPANIVAQFDASGQLPSDSDQYICVTGESTLNDEDIASGYMDLFPEDHAITVARF